MYYSADDRNARRNVQVTNEESDARALGFICTGYPEGDFLEKLG